MKGLNILQITLCLILMMAQQACYHRLRVGIDLSEELGISITSFPMRFVPISDVKRHFISEGWRWRWIRGIQCILNATHGMVSPNQKFFDAAFGQNYEEFLDIINMPDRYILYRNKYKNDEAKEWKKLFSKLKGEEFEKFQDLLRTLNGSRNRESTIMKHPEYRKLLNHYYPDEGDVSQTTLADYRDPRNGWINNRNYGLFPCLRASSIRFLFFQDSFILLSSLILFFISLRVCFEM